MSAPSGRQASGRQLGVAASAALIAGALACTSASAPPVPPQVSIAAGQHAYKTKCASCHGLDAAGSGDRAGGLTPRPADLTRIAARNGGVFSADDVVAHVDGRVLVEHHGPRSMPVWGETGVLTEQQLRDVVRYLETLQRR